MIGDSAGPTHPRYPFLSKLLPFLAIAGTLALLSAVPGVAQDLPRADSIAKMELKQLRELTGAVTASVGQDTLKLQPAAKARNCLELTRAANAFALGYSMLAEVDKALAGKPPKEAAPLKANVIQSRIITFAARVRAEEWLSRICVGYVPPPEQAGEARYTTPAKLQTAEFTTAVIEARQVAEANLALAVQAGMAKNCQATYSALESIQLLVPYLEKLVKDVATRPQALGPRASRRGLEVVKLQLVNAGNKLYREVGIGCAKASPSAGQGGESPKPVEAPPVEPTAPVAP
jgi:hypothetical protein